MWTQSDLAKLAGLWSKANYFAMDADDEFRIQRRDGSTQGIFKTFALPVVPFLDADRVNLFQLVWQRISALTSKGVSFREAAQSICATRASNMRCKEALAIISSWQHTTAKTPVRLQESLDRVVTNCWLLDRRLIGLFADEPLPSEISERMAALANRLVPAFGLASPFYNLEALAGNASWLGSGQHSSPLSGRLDVVALLLPSAFRTFVHAAVGNWNGLTWKQIRRETRELIGRHSSHTIVLLNIARILGVEPHWVLFAANALEYIPRRVGGKKNDMTEAKALDRLVPLVQGEVHATTSLDVLREANALIRFRNWLPLVEAESNFSGLTWTYAAVCDTTMALLETLRQHPETLSANALKEFLAVEPQLNGLDATSAIGRFLLELIITERGLKNRRAPLIDVNWQTSVIQRLAEASREAVTDATLTVYPRSLVGAKPHGIALAGHVLGPHKVLECCVVTTEQVERFLREQPSIWSVIERLNRSSKLDAKERLAERVYEAILHISLPDWLKSAIAAGISSFTDGRLAVRASSLVEGEARGVHETVLNAPRNQCVEAVLRCIASYYSQEAVCFRFLQRISDMPRLAVLLQPYVKNTGGVAERRPGAQATFLVTSGTTAAQVTSGGGIRTEWSGSERHRAPAELQEAAGDVEMLSNIFGPVQIEWARQDAGSGTALILQMEFLSQSSGNGATAVASAERWVAVRGGSEIAELNNTLKRTTDIVGISLGPTINPNAFQGEIMAVIARYPNRIAEIRSQRFISQSSHLANILRFYGVKLSS